MNLRKKIKYHLKDRILSKAEKQRLNQFKNVLPHEMLPIHQTTENDIFIAGFPKSGNTWMQNLICGLQYGIDTSLLPDTLTQELVPDLHSKKYYKRFSDTVFFKTHNLPHEKMKRVIHLVRDGRDVMASYFAMNKALRKQITLKDMIVDGKEVYPSKWHIHTRKWLDNPYGADILIIKYEDLIADTFHQLQRILEFTNISRDKTIIERTIKGNTFQEMKRKEKDFGWDNKKWDKNENFIRKGTIGSYEDEIPKTLVKHFESEAYEELCYFKYLKEC